MRRWRTWLSALIILFSPRRLKPFLLNLLGHRVGRRASLGFSLILVDRLYLEDGARIAGMNLISCRRLLMRKSAYFQALNVVIGPLSIRLAETAAIGKRNVIRRAPNPVSYGPAQLRLGTLSKLTLAHSVDCMRSVVIGDYTTVAGKGSQLWTHGYRHEPCGPGRVRIEGSIHIGNNTYIGSGCILSMGIRIADGVTIGSLSSVSKNLERSGLYVSQPLRHIESDIYTSMERLEPLPSILTCERVYRKRGAPSQSDRQLVREH